MQRAVGFFLGCALKISLPRARAPLFLKGRVCGPSRYRERNTIVEPCLLGCTKPDVS